MIHLALPIDSIKTFQHKYVCVLTDFKATQILPVFCYQWFISVASFEENNRWETPPKLNE